MIRSKGRRFPSALISNIIVNAVRMNKRVLYLHFVDYHRRYWSIDADSMIDMAKSSGVPYDRFVGMVSIVREFTTDQMESDETWRKIDSAVTNRFRVFVVDSLSELYEDDRNQTDPKNLVQVMGRLKRLSCAKSMAGVVIDHSDRPMTQYIMHSCSVILEASRTRRGVRADLVKHPFLPNQSVELVADGGRLRSAREIGLWGYL